MGFYDPSVSADNENSSSASGMFGERWRELAGVFLKLGVMSYGGSAMLGIMQAEIAERRQWLSNDSYLEGVGVVNMLPGPPAVQLAILIGYTRAGWKGGVLAGLCFMLPAFVILMGLTLAYSAFGSLEPVRGALLGMGVTVLAIFASAIYRLGLGALNGSAQGAIAVSAALAVAVAHIGVASVLLGAGCAGVALYRSRRQGLIALSIVALLLTAGHYVLTTVAVGPGMTAYDVRPEGISMLARLAVTFMKIGAVTFGGGLVMVSLIQEHFVTQMQWLTSREFLDGLALGQLTPGPTLMISAYIGYKSAGLTGAVVSALSMFAPAFLLMLTLLPILQRFRHLLWIKPAMRGVSAAVIGCLVVTLMQLVPHAAPDRASIVVLVVAALGLCRWRVPPLPLIACAAVLGMAVHGMR